MCLQVDKIKEACMKKNNMNIDYLKIDIGIRDLIKLFNEKGMPTKHSCAGHVGLNRKNQIVAESAYIEFDDSVGEDKIRELFSLVHKHNNNRIINDFHIDKYFRELEYGGGNIISRWKISFPKYNFKNKQIERFKLKEECFKALENALKEM